ncbi:MAG: TetR/AcrR family transcriptional regulator [Ktedonobacteraceae bacterium]
MIARGEATRHKILDAAEEVLGEVGYHKASTAEITQRAGVAQGTYYIYFHSTREVFPGIYSQPDPGHGRWRGADKEVRYLFDDRVKQAPQVMRISPRM